MAKINLPENMLGKDSFKTLPAKEKEEYVGNLLKQIIDLNGDGVTISQIRDGTGLTYSTIWHHLEVLCCTAQGNKISRGNMDVYYPEGKFNKFNEYVLGKASYIISTVEGNEGKLLCFHEKRQNGLGNHTVCEGITMPVEIIDDLIKELKKIKKSAKKK